MKKTKVRQNGMTLIEVMIGLLLTAIVLSGIFGLLTTSLTSWKAGSSQSEIQQTARFAVDSMVRDLRFGDTYVMENNKSIKYRSSKKDTKGNYYRYYISNHKLYREGMVPSSTPQPVTGNNVNGANNIVINQNNEVMFTMPDANSITVRLIATDTFTGQSWEINTSVVSITQALK